MSERRRIELVRLKRDPVLSRTETVAPRGGRAAAAMNLDLGHSWLIGDAPRDIEAGLGARITLALPYDSYLYLKAVNEGVPVVLGAPRSAAAQQLTRAGHRVVGDRITNRANSQDRALWTYGRTTSGQVASDSRSLTLYEPPSSSLSTSSPSTVSELAASVGALVAFEATIKKAGVFKARLLGCGELIAIRTIPTQRCGARLTRQGPPGLHLGVCVRGEIRLRYAGQSRQSASGR